MLAPTGTIGFMMDCDTTGIEPDFSLVKFKKLVGGGSMQIVNQTVPRALRRFGYPEETIEAIVEHIAEHGHVVDAPGLRPEHYEVFDCADGRAGDLPDGACADDGGGPAVHLGRDLQDGEHAGVGHGRGDRGDLLQGLEDGHQGPGDLPGQLQGRPAAVRRPRPRSAETATAAGATTVPRPERSASGCHVSGEPRTTSFTVGGADGYITAGSYPGDGLGEVFLKLGKQGSTLAGVMDAFSIAISVALQYGVPLETYAEKFTNMRFEPAGMTDDPDIRMAQSMMDYIFRRLALDYLPFETRSALGIYTAAERARQLETGSYEPVEEILDLDGPSATIGRTGSDLPPSTTPRFPYPSPVRTPLPSSSSSSRAGPPMRRFACPAGSRCDLPGRATSARVAARPAGAADDPGGRTPLTTHQRHSGRRFTELAARTIPRSVLVPRISPHQLMRLIPGPSSVHQD